MSLRMMISKVIALTSAYKAMYFVIKMTPLQAAEQWLWAGGLARWIKFLPCKYEDQTADLRNPHKSRAGQVGVAAEYNPSTQKGEK